MPVSEANKKAARKYIAANIKQIKFGLSMKYDADILAHLDAQENKQGYIKALIREDIARAKSGEAPAQNSEQARPEAAARAKVSTAPAQNIMMEDTTMEYKENSTRAKSENLREEKVMNTRIAICTINHNTDPDTRVAISYDPAQKAIYTDTPGEEDMPIAENLETLEAAEDTCDAMYNVPCWDLEWIEHDDLPTQKSQSAQNVTVEDTTMEYKANSLSQSLPIDAQKDALPIRDQQEEVEQKMWYAVQVNREDDWGTGSYDREEAIRMAREQLAEYPDTLIAVIDNSTSDPVCVDEITDLDDYETPSDDPAQNPDATTTTREDDPGVPSGGNPWYAVLATSEDDWSKGSFNLDEAKAMAREIRKKHPGAMIAVIDNSLDYPFCSDTITDF